MLNGLDLFSGIGGITLGLSGYVQPVAYCEIDRYCQSVLLSRMQDRSLPRAPIWDDITSLTRAVLPSAIDIIYGGFPCQDISVAGNGRGLAGERSGLFFELFRLVKEIKPRFVFLENVPAIRTRGLREVIESFTSIGYDCRWTIVSAADVGAPHLRKRWFLLAHAIGGRVWEQPNGFTERKDSSQFIDNGQKESVAEGERWSAMADSGSTGNGPEHRAMGTKEVQREQEPSLPFGDCSKDMANSIGAGLEIIGEQPARQEQPPSERSSEAMANSQGIGWCEGRAESERQQRNIFFASHGNAIREFNWAIEPNVGRVVNGLSFRVDRIKGLGNAVVPLQARTAFERLVGIQQRITR